MEEHEDMDAREEIFNFIELKIKQLSKAEEHIDAMQKEIDELRQEITVLKTLLPPQKYTYGIDSNASGY